MSAYGKTSPLNEAMAADFTFGTVTGWCMLNALCFIWLVISKVMFAIADLSNIDLQNITD